MTSSLNAVMPRVAVGLVWMSVAASLAGFLMPWARLDLGAQLAAIVEPPGHTQGSPSSSFDASGATSRARVLPPTAGGPRRGAEAAPAGYRGAREVPRAVGRVTVQLRKDGETIAAALPVASEFPLQVSGIQIPWLARQERAQAAAALLELFTNSRQHATVKSHAVCLAPAVALLCGLLVTRWKHRPAVTGGVALVCAVIAALGFWRLGTLDTASSLIVITIERGLWLSLWAYVGLAASAGWLTVSRRART